MVGNGWAATNTKTTQLTKKPTRMAKPNWQPEKMASNGGNKKGPSRAFFAQTVTDYLQLAGKYLGSIVAVTDAVAPDAADVHVQIT